ncbi:MAG: glycosyltransferase [Candidatus Didemnitutus sp.]|nr:glycosyltransferase [Candidatus Didemnitutus sp.]
MITTLAGGGSERVCFELANQWAREGRRVELLLVRRDGVFLTELDPRVQVAEAGVRRVRHALFWLLRQLNRSPRVPTLLFGFELGTSLGALRRLGLVRAPLVYREGSCPVRNIPAVSHWKYAAFVGAVDGMIAQSEQALGNLRLLGAWPPVHQVIWNPAAKPAMNVVSGSSGGPAAALRLVAIGRLSPEKGYARLIDAVARLRSQGRSVTLTIAGEGSQRASLEARIDALGLRSSVNLVGFIAQPTKLLAEADYFVLGSHYEGQPNALLEALQRGARVVAAGGAGVGELLGVLGLGACWISEGEADFVVALESALDRAGQLPAATWRDARAELARRTAIEKVAGEYRRVMEACVP